MFENKYIEECIKKHEGSYDVLYNYSCTKKKGYEILVINDLGFIADHEDKLKLFKDTLLKANVKEFLLTEKSTALMEILHAFNTIGITIKEVKEIKYTDKLFNEDTIIKGLLMQVES